MLTSFLLQPIYITLYPFAFLTLFLHLTLVEAPLSSVPIPSLLYILLTSFHLFLTFLTSPSTHLPFSLPSLPHTYILNLPFFSLTSFPSLYHAHPPHLSIPTRTPAQTYLQEKDERHPLVVSVVHLVVLGGVWPYPGVDHARPCKLARILASNTFFHKWSNEVDYRDETLR